MKKIILITFIIFFLFLILSYKTYVFGAHACRQQCTPGSCVSGLVCRGNPPQCKNPDCGDRWDCVCKHANCKNLSGPTTVVVGETYTYSVTYEDLYKPVIKRGITVLTPIGEKNCDWNNPIFHDESEGGAETINWNWTPTNPGRYVMICRAWSQDDNGDIYECQGRCLYGKKVYGCKGPDSYLMIDVITPTPAYRIQGWKLLKKNNEWTASNSVNNLSISISRVGNNYSQTKNENPYFFEGPAPTPGVPGQYDYIVSAQELSGTLLAYTLCYNNWQCYTSITPTPGSSVVVESTRALTENFSGTGDRYVSIRWYYTPLIPNARNVSGPLNVIVGDQVEYRAEYLKNEAPNLTNALMFAYQNDCLGVNLNRRGNFFGEGIYNFTWTPASAGNYIIFAKADSSFTSCIGHDNCVTDHPLYKCLGPNSYLSVNAQNANPWYKLKDASLNKIGDHNITVVQNVNKFSDSDVDDTTSRYTIINSPNSNPGIILTTSAHNPGPFYNPIPDSVQNWHLAYYGNFNKSLINVFYQYVISRKSVKEIANLNEINNNGSYIIKNNNLDLSTQPPNYNFILIVRNTANNDLGNVLININNFNNGNKSIMILAKNISFSSSVNIASGIFIGEKITYQSNNGLKISGNLISKNEVTLRERSDNSRPSLFVVFKPKMYLDLLPYLSISKYDWQQLQ